MPRVAEIHAERFGRFGCPIGPARLMADVARRHRSSGRSGVTFETRRVCVRIRRDRERYSSSGRSVTDRAVRLMNRVVEFSTKASKSREPLHRSTLRVSMANGAYRAVIVRELQGVAAGA